MRPYLGPVVAVIAWHTALMGIYVSGLGGGPDVLVAVGASRLGRPPYESIHHAIKMDGYDGQFYYALAQSPLRRHEDGIDTPGLRHLRILYPALAFLLSGGDPDLLLFVLPLINLLAIGGLAALGVFLARRQGLSPWWGVLLPLALNVALPAFRDLTDVIASLAVCGLLAAWLTRAPWWVIALCAAASLLAREQNSAVVGVIVVVALWRRQTLVCAGLMAAVALWCSWIGFVWHLYGCPPFASASHHFGLPFAGMSMRLTHLNELKSISIACHLVNLALILAQLGLAACVLRKLGDPVLALVILTGASMAVLGSFAFYEDYWSSTRVFVLLPLGAWLACVQMRWRFALAGMACVVVLPIAVVCKSVLLHS